MWYRQLGIGVFLFSSFIVDCMQQESLPVLEYSHDFFHAASEDRIDLLRKSLASGADVNATGLGFMTALHYAAMYRAVEAVKFLIGQGAAVDSIDDDGQTPLHLAVSAPRDWFYRPCHRSGNDREMVAQIVASLCDAGAKVDCLDCDGVSPLAYAERFWYSGVTL